MKPAEYTPKPGVKLTPLMQQYWDIKSAHQDKVVLFRMGDFFEMFFTDAETAAPVLGIALTSRNKKSADETPMCGVPHHSVANSINKLLAQGYKVAICDQVEDPKNAKTNATGIVKRAVTRILSPGVVYDPDQLDGTRPNYLASFDERSISFIDTTTGETFFYLLKDPKRVANLLRSLAPVEIVLSKVQAERFGSTDLGQEFKSILTVHEGIQQSPGVDWPDSALRLLAYAVHMQGIEILETLSPFERRELFDRMDLPLTAMRHLEVFSTYKGDIEGSLFHAIDRSKTSMGSRLLKQWLTFPLIGREAIERRQDSVEQWVKRSDELTHLRSALTGLGDIQRRLGKLGSPSCHPRDLLSLADSLRAGLRASSIASCVAADLVPKALLERAENVAKDIERTITDDPPMQMKAGGVIRQGVTLELDELITLSTESHRLIMELEIREREATGISSLKIRFNNVFGYYIEITNTHKDKVPKDRYDRKQTLANAERYLTKELAELESKVLSAQAKRLELEDAMFHELVARCLSQAKHLLELAGRWAALDVVSALAFVALEQNYVRPRFNDRGSLKLIASRHPVVEQSMALPFVANTIEISRGACMLLTGPNMAGKSTLMRQVAITVLLAQIGASVPAEAAELPIFNRVFTRIGASDFLTEGLSTFMVEMKETAELLECADEETLVVLDEIGRGTSTYDGMSLAQAILEFLIENKKSMTLFATHYHELTLLGAHYAQVMNAHMSIHETQTPRGPEITFLHQLAKGPANKSYGIHVGKLAGLPSSVTKRAQALLKRLESDREPTSDQMSLLGHLDETQIEVEKSPEMPDALLEVHVGLQQMDLSKVTPLEALNQIARWQQSLS
jgi:DNA mismatch repair protein MutS